MRRTYKGLEIDFHQLIHNSLQPIMILDNFSIVYLNKSAINLFGGQSAKDLLDRNFHELLHPSFYQVCRERTKKVIDCQENAELMEQQIFRLDGEIIYVEVMATPFYLGGEVLPQVIIRDITDRKLAEKLAIRTEKLAAAGQLAAGVVHEIRNPVTAIKGFLHLHEEGHIKKEYIQIMRSEIERIELILNEMLILSKPTAKIIDQKEIKSILNHIIALLETQAIYQNVELIANFESVDMMVKCDENQLKQVFVNLVKNAIEAMPHGGRLTISSKVEDDYIVIKFTDEGCGIPKEILSKLGDPFLTTKEKGTGLGLMVSYKIIKEHKGTISVSSEIDIGTTFEIKFPREKYQNGEGEVSPSLLNYHEN
jgi:two-component system sporulation sensor kinase A